MCMKVCLCMGVCVSLGDGGSVGSQGKRARFGHGLSPGCIMAAWYTTGRLLGFMIEI